ncbi:hypothetical protein [Bordetella muralis]|uniref:hypothetical protein n=1 Tax=Bordetella muralis TaxID=1649130 RepID=UPI0039EEE61C
MSETIQIPSKAPGKSGAASLQQLERIHLQSSSLPNDLNKGLYTYAEDNFQYDFIYRPSSTRRLFVLLSGYVDRKLLSPPVFQRWSWAKYFPGHSLYIADPSLNLEANLGLAWYVGTEANYILPSVAELILRVAKKIDIPLSDVIIYASSGGGFAALKLAALIPEVTSVVINPQTEITKYDNPGVERFLRTCFNGLTRERAIEQYRNRLSVFPDIEKLKARKIIYAQNLIDTHHINDHFLPFAAQVGLEKESSYSNKNIKTIFFENEGGHGKGESPEVFPSLIRHAINISAAPLQTFPGETTG